LFTFEQHLREPAIYLGFTPKGTIMASPALGMEPKDSVRAAIEGRVEPNEFIAALTYEYWQRRGCPDGSPELDWFQAEADIRSWRQAEENLKKQTESLRGLEETAKDTHSEGEGPYETHGKEEGQGKTCQLKPRSRRGSGKNKPSPEVSLVLALQRKLSRDQPMKTLPVAQHSTPVGRLTVLSISPNIEDHASLQAIIGNYTKWELLTARDIPSALAVMHQKDVAVLLCEQDVMPGMWKDVLELISTSPNPPSLIISARRTDERLWAEALNLGVSDVLAKPFNKIEVLRSVQSAWQHWYDLQHMAGQSREAEGGS
jgi:CheY-like chemotaxis protein